MMYESAIQFIGVTVAFCAIAIGLFFIIGLTMNYGWQVMQNAVWFYRLHRCYRMVSRVMKKKERRK